MAKFYETVEKRKANKIMATEELLKGTAYTLGSEAYIKVVKNYHEVPEFFKMLLKPRDGYCLRNRDTGTSSCHMAVGGPQDGGVSCLDNTRQLPCISGELPPGLPEPSGLPFFEVSLGAL